MCGIFIFSIINMLGHTSDHSTAVFTSLFHPQNCTVCYSHQEEWDFTPRLNGIRTRMLLEVELEKCAPKGYSHTLVTVSEICCVGCGFRVQAVKHKSQFLFSSITSVTFL